MIYAFPIFCFGLVITGIAFLGLMEAADQVKRDEADKRREATGLGAESKPVQVAQKPRASGTSHE